jgi:hypothetical protein
VAQFRSAALGAAVFPQAQCIRSSSFVLVEIAWLKGFCRFLPRNVETPATYCRRLFEAELCRHVLSRLFH